MRLLIVDDDPELRDLLVRALERDGNQVVATADVASARQVIGLGTVDLVVLDLALPDGTGLELCEALRANASEMPVLMLTAHSEISQRVRALDAGADDFLAKPFAVAELRARVRALARRAGLLEPTQPLLVYEDVEIDCAHRRVTRAGKVVKLTAGEWAIVEQLAMQPQRLLARAQLLSSEVWGDTEVGSSGSLEVLIARIRRKLGNGLILTVRGEGYILEARTR